MKYQIILYYQLPVSFGSQISVLNFRTGIWEIPKLIDGLLDLFYQIFRSLRITESFTDVCVDFIQIICGQWGKTDSVSFIFHASFLTG